MREVTNNTNTTTKQDKSFIALRNTDGHVIAFINPAKNVNPQALVDALAGKGLHVAIETPNTESVSVAL